MTTVKVKNIEIGKGMPKICVPLVGKSKKEIFEELDALKAAPHDIVEWRADCFGEALDIENIISMLAEISENLKKKVLLFTFRTMSEGGAKSISAQEYLLLNRRVIESSNADIVDVELLIGDDIVKRLVHLANNNNKLVIMTSHDFEKTPPKETIIKRFCQMQELGADITKIAVMPITVKDAAIIMDVCAEMEECYADKPFVAISMSEKGIISRISGEIFGSAITFGSLKEPSAPGQLEAEDLRRVLNYIHKARK